MRSNCRLAALAVIALFALGTGVARAEPLRRCARGGDGCFLGADGTWRDAAVAYRGFVKRERPRYLRAAVEMALALGGGTAWYWIDRERQVADWDYPSLKQRFNFEAWRYDNNPFGINYIWHAMSGTAFHTLSRSNDLSLAESATYGFLTSMVWEYALEFREKISINDVIVTPGAGIATGEFFHWLGRYVSSAPGGGGRGHRIARWTLGLPQAAHDGLSGHGPPGLHANTDALGFSADIWHRFEIATGFAHTEWTGDADTVGDGESLQLGQLQLRGRLMAMPGYLRPGRFRKGFADGNLTELSLRIAAGDAGSGVDLRADTVLLGVHAQDVAAPTERGASRAITAGVGLGYQYRREELGGWIDRLGILHLPGLAVDANLLGSSWRVRAALRLHGDHAGVHALTYPRWKAAHPDAVEKTILRKQGYYYGWGASGRARLELELPRVALGGELFYGRYYSDEGLDRSQEEIEDDVKLGDRVLDADVWLRVTPVGERVYFEVRVLHQSRDAYLEDVRGAQDLRRYLLQLGLAL